MATKKTGYRTQVLYIVDAGNTIIAKTRIAYVPRTILALGLAMKCATKFPRSCDEVTRMLPAFVHKEQIARIAVRAIGTCAY